MIGLRRAFTLIELLVVVSIISILTLIAMPNMTLALTRAKISRVRNDMRVVANGLELYAVDYNKYPPTLTYANKIRFNSPVTDVFGDEEPFHYETPESAWGMSSVDDKQGTSFTEAMGFNWMLGSIGPDRDWYNTVAIRRENEGDSDNLLVCVNAPYRDYDATNGTISAGNIFRTDKNPELLNPNERFYQDDYVPFGGGSGSGND